MVKQFQALQQCLWESCIKKKLKKFHYNLNCCSMFLVTRTKGEHIQYMTLQLFTFKGLPGFSRKSPIHCSYECTESDGSSSHNINKNKFSEVKKGKKCDSAETLVGSGRNEAIKLVNTKTKGAVKKKRELRGKERATGKGFGNKETTKSSRR